MSVVLETRRERPQMILDVGDAFVVARSRQRARRPRPSGQLRARVLARATAPAETFDPAWRLVTVAAPGGVHAWFGRVRPDGLHAAPELDRTGVLGPGTYDVEISAVGYRPEPIQADVPEPDAAPTIVVLNLEPGPRYRFPDELAQGPVPAGSRSTGPTLIRGQILALDGSELEGIDVQAPGAAPARTDHGGSWVLVFADDAPSAPVVITATIDGAAVAAPAAVVTGRRTSVPQTRLHGRVVRGSDAPVAGAAVSVEGVPGSVSSGADGSWSIALPFGTGLQETDMTVTAVLEAVTRRAGVRVKPGESVRAPVLQFPNP